MNHATEQIVAKIYQQTHVKIEADDPIVSLLIAQQLLFDELTNDLADIEEVEHEKIAKLYKAAFEKAAVITSEMTEKIQKSVESSLRELDQRKEQAKTTEFSAIGKKISNLSTMVYLSILVNLIVIGEVIYVILRK